MRQKTQSGVKFLLSVMVLSTTSMFGNAAADTMFDEGRAKGAFAAIEKKAGHKLHLLSLTIRPEELRLLASSPNKPGEVETWRMQATPTRDVGNNSPALLSLEPAQLISGSLEDNLIDMDVNGLAIVPQLAGAALTRARLQSRGQVTAMELRRLPKIIEPGVRDPSWRVHVQGLNEEAEIYAKPNGEITLVDAQNTKRAQTLNLLEGGPDFEEIIQNIRSRMKDKWAFHYIEVGKTQIDVDVKLMTVRNPRMIRFTATLDDLKTYATSIPHQAFLGEPADDRFSLDDVDFSQLAKLASIARTKLPIADGIVQRVSLSKPHRERGGNIEWQVQVRSAHTPLFMGPNTPPVAEGSVSFDMSGNVLKIKSPPGFAPKTNLFDPTALQKAVDKIDERLGHHVLLTELMISGDNIDITAQDPTEQIKARRLRIQG